MPRRASATMLARRTPSAPTEASAVTTAVSICAGAPRVWWPSRRPCRPTTRVDPSPITIPPALPNYEPPPRYTETPKLPRYEEPLFYGPAPPDHDPHARPPKPSSGQFQEPDHVDHTTIGPYIPTDKTKPGFGTTRKPLRYETPRLDLHAQSKPPPPLNEELFSTAFPPPSHSYKQPSLKFVPKPIVRGLPPRSHPDLSHYKGGKALDYQDARLNSFHPPSKGYIPPVHLTEETHHKGTPTPTTTTTIHPAYHMSSTYSPPTKQYSKPHRDHEHMSPPHREYLPPKKQGAHMTTIHPPTKDYLPPEEDYKHYKMSTIRPPDKKYLPPRDDHKHQYQMSTMAPPSKDYLPPNKDYHSSMSTIVPPTRDYLPPKKDYHHGMSTIVPPSKDYLPPKKDFHHGMSTIVPPSKDYLPPKKDYRHEMSTMVPPSKDYLPPKKDYHPSTSTIVPPTRDYLPPKKDYHHGMTTIVPPSKDYLPPKKDYHSSMSTIVPPTRDYLPPKDNSYQVSTMKPPSREYLPPKAHDAHYKMSTMAPPSKDYIPPVHSSTIVPPTNDYLPSKDLTGYSPPSKGYLPPPKHANREDLIGYAPPSKIICLHQALVGRIKSCQAMSPLPRTTCLPRRNRCIIQPWLHQAKTICRPKKNTITRCRQCLRRLRITYLLRLMVTITYPCLP